MLFHHALALPATPNLFDGDAFGRNPCARQTRQGRIYRVIKPELRPDEIRHLLFWSRWPDCWLIERERCTPGLSLLIRDGEFRHQFSVRLNLVRFHIHSIPTRITNPNNERS